MNELADLVIEITGSSSKLVKKPLPADDPTQRHPVIALAKSLLSWEPRIPLAQGLETTVAWFSEIDLSLWTPPTPNFEGGLTEKTA